MNAQPQAHDLLQAAFALASPSSPPWPETSVLPPEDFHTDPAQHPRWLDQMDLEVEMLHLGVQRFRRLSAEAKQNQEETRLRPIRQLLTRFVEPVAAEVVKFRETANKKRGVRPIALAYLSDMDPEVIAYLTLKTVLDEASKERMGLTHIAQKVAMALMNEKRLTLWAAQNPALFGAIERRLEKDHATREHRKTVMKHAFNKLAKEALLWTDWPPADRLAVGIKAVEMLVTGTKRFRIKLVYMGKGSHPYVLEPEPETVEWLLRALKRAEVLSPVRLPTVIPPRRWSGLTGGGYYSQVIKPLPLVRHKGLHDKDRKLRKKHLEGALERGELATTFTALNALQETPWTINTKVLALAEMWWDREYSLKDMPAKSGQPLPHRPPEVDTDADALRQYKRKMRETKEANATLVQKTVTIEQTLLLAKRFNDGQPIYFPHNLDFRGRIYPIVSGLSPQGTDLAKGLLQFAHGEPIMDDEQAGWLWVHLANCWGVNKLSFGERIDWVDANEEMIRSIAADPMRDRRWTEADGGDSPWQFLAACLEWVAYREHGYGYISSLPIRVDGTCNGLQHLSAMLRDEEGGRATNLTPSDSPADIYLEVADKVTKRLRQIGEGGDDKAALANLWLGVCGPDGVPRALTKRPVMILPYGGTLMACRQYIEEWLGKEATPVAKALREHENFTAALTLMANTSWAAIHETVVAASRVMAWLRSVAKEAAVSGQPLFWTTPAGFPVWHKYASDKSAQKELLFEGVRIRIDHTTPTEALDLRQQLNGIAPNFVHSMDAAALKLCIVECHERGMVSFTAIHDSFGTTAASMGLLSDRLRASFYTMYEEHDVLAEFADTVRTMIPEGKEPKALEKGTLDLAGVLSSPYFFG